MQNLQQGVRNHDKFTLLHRYHCILLIHQIQDKDESYQMSSNLRYKYKTQQEFKLQFDCKLASASVQMRTIKLQTKRFHTNHSRCWWPTVTQYKYINININDIYIYTHHINVNIYIYISIFDIYIQIILIL